MTSLGKRVVADVADHLLTVGPLRPVDELLDRAGRLAGRVEIEKAADRVASVLRRLERRSDGGRRVVFLDLESLDALEVSDAPVADAELVALDRVGDRRCAGQGLRLRG